MLQDAELEIATLKGRASESRRRADDDGIRVLVLLHRRDEIVQRRADTRIGISADNKRRSLPGQDFFGRFSVWVDNGDDLQARAELVKDGSDIMALSLWTRSNLVL